MRVDRDRQTDILITILCAPPRGEVTTHHPVLLMLAAKKQLLYTTIKNVTRIKNVKNV